MSASGIDDLQRAARVLLKKPLVRSSDAESFRLVRRHAATLREWFDINTGWVLHVDSELARLAKEPATIGDSTHPLRTRDIRFSRRRYVLLMLCLAALERSDSQVALGRLAEQVVLLGSTQELSGAGFSFALTTREYRGDLVAVVQVLLDWGVLKRVAGDEQEFLQSSGDVLYDVSRRVLAQLLVSRRGPSVVSGESLDDVMVAMRDRGTPPSDELHNLRLRHSLTRRLLDDPVVYYTELSDDEVAYLRSQRSAICRRITEATGLIAEIRQEGLAMVDLDDDLTDMRMPEKGTDGHVTLIIAEHLAASTSAALTFDELEAHLRSVTPEYMAFWRGSSREAGAEVGLVRTAVGRLVSLRLAEIVSAEATSAEVELAEIRPDGVRALPALARFAVGTPTIAGEQQS